MNEINQPEPQPQLFFDVLCSLAHFGATVADVSLLVQNMIQVYLEVLPVSGVVVWLRDNERDMLAPGGSRLPKGYSTSALPENDELVQRISEEGFVLIGPGAADSLILLPEDKAVALVPIQSSDTLLGILGCVANVPALEVLDSLLVATANILSAPFANAWLRRQQAESEDVEDTLFQFAGELRAQRSLEDILTTLNNLALRLFACDWAGVYVWNDDAGGTFQPVQIMTRVGVQPLDDEPSLLMQQTPVFEMVFSDMHPTLVLDLRDQPTALPVYLERHRLRGLVLVPIQHETNPQGLLAIGYLAPLATFTSRASTMAQGLARMVAVALQRTRTRQQPGDPV